MTLYRGVIQSVQLDINPSIPSSATYCLASTLSEIYMFHAPNKNIPFCLLNDPYLYQQILLAHRRMGDRSLSQYFDGFMQVRITKRLLDALFANAVDNVTS